MDRYLKTRSYAALVESDGSVLVHDDVAGHYTRCHSLTEEQQRYIRGRARATSGKVHTRCEGQAGIARSPACDE